MGYCMFLGGNLVTCRSKKQIVVSCSSAEAVHTSSTRVVQTYMAKNSDEKDLRLLEMNARSYIGITRQVLI